MSHEESNQTDAVPTSLNAFASSIVHYIDQNMDTQNNGMTKKLSRLKGNGGYTK